MIPLSNNNSIICLIKSNNFIFIFFHYKLLSFMIFKSYIILIKKY